MRINGFEQIKSFYSWVFNNPDKVRPTHISLYLFLWNQGNRANWVEWFKCPYDLAMQGACIGSKGTYYRCLDDLQRFKLIKYEKGLNSFKSPKIHLIQLYNTGQLTEQVTVPLSEPQTEPLSELLTGNTYKLLTDNYKLVNKHLEEWLKPKDEENKTVVDRKQGFLLSMKKFESTYSKDMMNDFYLYWTEHGDKDKKMRFEKEKSFALNLRLSRWDKNNKKRTNERTKQNNSTGARSTQLGRQNYD